MTLEQTWVLEKDSSRLDQDLIYVIFEDMDSVWLLSMWETGGSACVDIIEILISLALLKLKSKL
jgi:hypothetical protein